MIDTILFDLDGTLLTMSQDAFLKAYFSELKKVFVKLKMDADESIKAVWAGTHAMVKDGGNGFNAQRFWTVFAECLSLSEEKRQTAEAACDSFYQNEFDAVKSVIVPNGVSKRIVRAMASKGYTAVLATNPLFPACAVATRLRWIGLELSDFSHITHYSNSKYCKPHPGYYRDIFETIGKEPGQCLMIGNHPVEDMSVGALGAETFLVTDCLENESGTDITAFRHGTLAELERYLNSL
ncbi:MAG: HAD family hydrolase [Oscillospiraceae bacterium]|jgi:FMN phosphatase YigB (HAD superfamily)|nr:HAD family hydrolase [Oscillospiraceae bacterium]